MESFKLGHRKALDGVRGLAILMVLLYHASLKTFGGGFIGVDLFFVLSGFLITSLLLEEARGTGGIRLKAFYVRRTLRLLPALLLVLGTMVAVSFLTEPPPASAAMRTSVVITLFYSANWFLAFRAYPRGELSATWSLSVEEQFYIVWPLLLLLLLRAGLSRRGIAGVVAVLLLASAGARAFLWTTTQNFERVMFGTDTHADGLLAGVLAALLVEGGAAPARGATLVALACFAIFLPLGWPAEPYMFFGGFLVLNTAGAVLVSGLATSPWRLFEWAPLVWVGRVSYGLYLWHFAAPWIVSQTGLARGGWHEPASIALTFAAAAASFYALERPILRYKKRFERVGPEGRSSL